MPITVRAIEAGDKTRWLDLFEQYINFYEETVAADTVELTWQRLLAKADGMLGLAAVKSTGEVAGIAHSVFHRSTWSATTYCYLEDLFVDPTQRGGGIGRALIDAVTTEAAQRGADRTYWVTAATNATARRLYDQVAELTPFVQYRT
jgi:ribosomal protein S18 acetylase RimI-like enzyme